MAESDDIALGKICSRCSVEFTEPHGHPVLCEICWDNDEDDDAEDRPEKATNQEVPE